MIITKKALPRRTFLKSVQGMLALPRWPPLAGKRISGGGSACRRHPVPHTVPLWKPDRWRVFDADDASRCSATGEAGSWFRAAPMIVWET